MTKIVALCGKKQSGKTTLSNYLHGHEMKRHDVIEKFFISPIVELVVNCTFHDENGKEFEEMGVLDLQQKNDEFYQYASRRIWPLIRCYNFADSLKEICTMLFNIPPECVYGSDEQKNAIQEHLRWENMPGMDKTIGAMTSREFMQFFGTEIMRKMYEPIWLENCFKRIEEDKPDIAIIADCRFMNEVKAVQQRNGKVIRLTRNPYSSNHASEVDADKYDGFDGTVDNQQMTIEESCKEFLSILVNLNVTQKLREVGKYTVSIK